MKKLYIILLLLAAGNLAFAADRFWIATTTGNWNDITNWSATTGGAGGASVPGVADRAIFNGIGGRNGNCVLNISPSTTVAGIIISGYSGTIDLQGNILITTGANTFTSGTISNTGAAASLTFNNTTLLTKYTGTLFNVPLTGTSGRLVFSGSIFNGAVTLTKSDNTTDDGAGGNTFNGALTITKTGTGELRFGNTNPDIFNTIVINQNATGAISIARTSANTQFNGNISINYNSTGSVLFGANGGTSTLANTRTLTVTSGGAGSGNLTLSRVTQVGTTAQTITLAGNQTATLTLGPACVFNGSLTTSSPVLVFNSSTFNNAANFTQTSDNNGASRGGNLFQGVTSFTNTGNGDIQLGATAGDPGDVFNGVSTFNDLGGGRIRVGESTAGNIFNADATFNSSGAVDDENRIHISRYAGSETTFNASATFINNGNSSDVQISFDAGTLTTFNGPLILISSPTANGDFQVGNDGNVVINGDLQVTSTSTDDIRISSGTGTVTFGNGTISVGGGGFSQGQLTLRNFTKTGTAAVNLTLTGTSILELGPASSFNGNFTAIAPRLILNGATYNGTTYLEKTGATADDGIGNNVFNGTTTFANSGAGSFRSGVSGLDTFNGNLTLNNTGPAAIQLSYQVAGSVYNGNIVVTSTSGTGISFGANGGTSTLATGRTITIGGAGFTTGDLTLSRFTQQGTTAQALTLTNVARIILGPASQFNGDVTFTAPRMQLNGTTYNGAATLQKNGINSDTGVGNNIFNGVTQITHSGSNDLITANGGPDTFNADVTFSNTGAGTMYIAHNVPGTVFNGNIRVNSTGISAGIYFSENANGTSTLAPTRTIAVGGLGFTVGILKLQRFTQQGATPQAITLTSTGLLQLAAGSQFNGNVTFIAPRILLNGTTFNGTAYIEKNGTGDNIGTGGNVFSSTTTLVNSGSGTFELSNTVADIFNGNLTVTNTGQSRIQIGIDAPNLIFNGNVTVNHGGNTSGVNTIIARNAGCSATFNGDLTLNCTNLNTGSGIIVANDATVTVNGNITVSSTAGRGVLFGAASGLVTLSNGFSLNVVPGTFTTGTLTLKGFTQLGTTPQAVTLSGVADLTLGPASTFNGTVDFITPRIVLDGTTFNNTTHLEKTGTGNNTGAGNNVFNGVTTIENSGSGNFISAGTSQDVFNNDLTLINRGLGLISMADNSPGNLFNGNITVNSTSGGGIYFGNNANASASLANGRTLTVGGSGFTAGQLLLRRFTQIGATPQSITLTSNAILRIGLASTFNGNAAFSAPRLFADGCTFNGTAALTKTGAVDDNGNGGNIFNGTASITNTGTGFFLTGNGTGDIFNGDLTVTNSNVASVRLADNSTGNQFNGNIYLTNTAGVGIYFGNTSGNSTLANGRTLNLGGVFNTGELRIRRFTQVGTTPQSLTLTGTTNLRVGTSSIFNGNVTFSSPQLLLEGSTYNGVTILTKTGGSTSNGVGGDVFNSTTSIINTGGGRFRMASTNGDTFNGPVTFTRSGAGDLEPAYSQTNFFTSDITTNSNTAIVFGAGGGVVELTGSNAQSINRAAGAVASIVNLRLNKSAQDVTLNTTLNTNQVLFTSGVIHTTSPNYINFPDNAIATGANDLSYVDGPVRKTGNEGFTFPVGDNGFYRPITISAPTATTHFFTAQYFLTPQPFGGASTWDPSFWTVSACEYWVLDRNAGASSDVSVTLSWNENACGGAGYVTDPADLRVTRWNNTNWVNLGNGGTAGSSSNGTIVSAAPVTAFSPFTLASTTIDNPLPIELKKFWAVDNGPTVTLNWITASELNNHSFTVQRSPNGIDFNDLYEVSGAGTTAIETYYDFVDEAPLSGLSYYRLKQKDYDGKIAYPGIVSVHRKGEGQSFSIHPNPAGDEVVRFNQKANIVIINSLDQTVATATEVDRIDVSSLPAGVYIIRNQNGQIARLVKK